MLATFAFVLALQGAAPRTDTALVSEVAAVQPGAPFTVALRMRMAPDWHTYFLNPGDAGQATEIHWKLPPGYKAGPIQWPVPRRENFGGIASYVYEDEIWLLSQITPPKTLKPGAPVHLAAHCTWLLCSTGCVPQSSDLALDLKVQAKAVPNMTAAQGFETARKALPLPLNNVRAVATAKGKAVVIRFPGMPEATQVRFIPSDVDAFGANEPTAGGEAGDLVLTLPMTAYSKTFPKVVEGILVQPSGAVWIRTPVIQPGLK